MDKLHVLRNKCRIPASFQEPLLMRQPQVFVFLFLMLATVFSGCTPAGPRALLDGKRLIEQGKYTQAVERLKTATSLLVSNAHAWNYLGLAYHNSRQAVAAENAYLRALFLNRDLSEAHYNLGCLWLEQGKFVPAKNEFMAYILRRANSREGLVKLGLAQLRCHDTQQAEKTFGEVLRLMPKNAQALNGMGLLRIQQRRPAEAAQYFKFVLTHEPNFRPALLNLAIVLHQYLKQPEMARQKYREYVALKPAPDNVDAVRAVLLQLEQELIGPALSSTATNTVTTTLR